MSLELRRNQFWPECNAPTIGKVNEYWNAHIRGLLARLVELFEMSPTGESWSGTYESEWDKCADGDVLRSKATFHIHLTGYQWCGPDNPTDPQLLSPDNWTPTL